MTALITFLGSSLTLSYLKFVCAGLSTPSILLLVMSTARDCIAEIQSSFE